MKYSFEEIIHLMEINIACIHRDFSLEPIYPGAEEDKGDPNVATGKDRLLDLSAHLHYLKTHLVKDKDV